MTPTERMAVELARRFPGAGVDAAALSQHPAFRAAAEAALRLLDECAVVEAVLAQGRTLRGAEDPHRVLVWRLQQVPRLVEVRARVAAEPATAEREAVMGRVDMLARLVRAGTIPVDVAEEELAGGLSPELAAAALGRLHELVALNAYEAR
jgi:hypothetical protein